MSSRAGGGAGGRQNPNNKMRIRAFPATMDDKYVNKIWEMLKSAIQEIQRKNNSGLSFEELYRNAYTMVLHKHGDRLYNGLSEVVAKHLRENVRLDCEKSVETGDFLAVLNAAWNDHTTAMVMIRDILMYMDRVYVAQNNVDNVYGLGLRLFRDNVTHCNNIQNHLTLTLLDMIHRERLREKIDRMAVGAACKMLMALGVTNSSVYEDDFETPFLRETTEFYKLESQSLVAENSASVYVERVERRLNEESQRAKLCLDPSTEPKVVAVLNRELIIAHMQTVVEMENSGFVYMLNNERMQDLRRLYSLLSRVDGGTKTMTECLSKHLREQGGKLVTEQTSQATNPVHYMQSMLDLKTKYDSYLVEAFNNDPAFKKRIQADFEHFINSHRRSSEFLSLFIDHVLKESAKKVSEADAEAQLDRAMVMFRLLEEKDMFERYYKQHLAKRLLHNKTTSDDMEKMMIGKLKTECGCQYPSKLECMFKDMQVTATLHEKWRDSLNNRSEKQMIELDVKVLTTGSWPTQPSASCQLPKDMQAEWERYSTFYVNAHSGRKIQLAPTMGGGEIVAYFYGAIGPVVKQESNTESESMDAGASTPMLTTPRKHILQLTTTQMVVLQLFSVKNEYTADEIKQETALAEKDVMRTLQSFAMGKQRILTRQGKGKDIDPNDVFAYNEYFTSKLTRVKVPMVSSKADTEPEQRVTRQKVDEDRRHEIEAAIVRVMKSRKTLSLQRMIVEVTEQLVKRFPPNTQQIKVRVESLIERDYLKRDPDDQRKLTYVA